MKKRRNDIKNEMAYFYKSLKNMDIDDKKKQLRIDAYEVFIDELSKEYAMETVDIDEKITEESLLGWIEVIEDTSLYKAVKSLTEDEQRFISYIFQIGLTQRELRKIYKITQPAINLRFRNILKKIKTKLISK